MTLFGAFCILFGGWGVGGIIYVANRHFKSKWGMSLWQSVVKDVWKPLVNMTRGK